MLTSSAMRCRRTSTDWRWMLEGWGWALNALAVDDKVPLNQSGGERVAVEHLTSSRRPAVDAHPHVHLVPP